MEVKDSRIPSIIHSSWHKVLQPLFDDPKMEYIRDKLLSEEPFYPSAENIFKVFSMSPDDIKVVIIGQDPYYNGQATGLAFGVEQGTPIPPSLKVIKEEVIRNMNGDPKHIYYSSNYWNTLLAWEYQGVFLLNSALTVRQGKAKTHINYWHWFTREVVKFISTKKVIWMMWGRDAQSLIGYITPSPQQIVRVRTVENVDKLNLDLTENIVLWSDHPAAEKYNGGTSGSKFTGNNHFFIANYLLELKGGETIHW